MVGVGLDGCDAPGKVVRHPGTLAPRYRELLVWDAGILTKLRQSTGKAGLTPQVIQAKADALAASTSVAGTRPTTSGRRVVTPTWRSNVCSP